MENKTLREVYESNPGLKTEFPDFNGKGVSSGLALKDWWAKYGKTMYPGISVLEENDPKLVQTELPLARFSSDPTVSDQGSNENTVWLYDAEQRTYRPVASPAALMKLTGASNVSDAFKRVTVLSTDELKNNSQWEGSFISAKDAIGDDGRIPSSSTLIPNSNLYQGKSSYGLADTDRNKTAEELAAKVIGVKLTEAKQKGYISESVFNRYLNNASNLQKYVDALVYGGYNIKNNIYGDLRIKTLQEEGNHAYDNVKAFDSSLTADEWAKTDSGKAFDANQDLHATEDVMYQADYWGNPIYQVPDSAFQTLVKPLDKNSKEFKEEASKIEANYYDVLMQNAEATTEQEKALADSNYAQFKEDLEKKYDITLSNNAKTAWSQIEQLVSTMSQRGLSGSGVFNELQDDYLRSIRSNNELQRENQLDEGEDALRDKLLNSASSEEINDFINSSEANKAKAEAWGLIPSDAQKNYYSLANLKKLYPSSSEDELKLISSLMIDENGNYRSKLYQNLYANKYQLSTEKTTYQEQQLENKKLVEEEEAYAPYTSNTSNPFSKEWGESSIDPTIKNEKANGNDVTVDNTKKTQREIDLENIRKALNNQDWTPSAAFNTDLQNKGIYGAVRVKGANNVYTIGSGGAKLTPETYRSTFGTDNQNGIVGEISPEQAAALGIKEYGNNPTPAASSANAAKAAENISQSVSGNSAKSKTSAVKPVSFADGVLLSNGKDSVRAYNKQSYDNYLSWGYKQS